MPFFTLIELLVVIAILSILAGLILPTLWEAKNSAFLTLCTNNTRQMYTAVALYADCHDGHLMHTNWLAQETGDPDFNFPGWLYRYDDISGVRKPEHVETGAMWEYLKNYKSYHCPLHRGWDDGSNQGTRALTSFLMSGVTNDFSYKSSSPVSERNLFRLSEMAPDGILWTEQDETANVWNDGSNYPHELIRGWGTRHDGRAVVISFDSHVETLTVGEAQYLEAQDPGRFWCCPVHTNGH